MPLNAHEQEHVRIDALPRHWRPYAGTVHLREFHAIEVAPARSQSAHLMVTCHDLAAQLPVLPE